MTEQLAVGVIGFAGIARLMPNADRGESGRAPREEDVDADKWAVVVNECTSQLGAECTPCADHAGIVSAGGALQHEFGNDGSKITDDSVWFLFRRAVDYVESRVELDEQLGQLLRRMLQVVIHGDGRFKAGGADAGEDGIVLSIVPHHAKAAHPRVLDRESLDDRPTFITTTVVDEDQLMGQARRLEHRSEPGDKVRQDSSAVVDRHDHGQAGTKWAGHCGRNDH